MGYRDCFWRQVNQVMGGVEKMVRGVIPAGMDVGGVGEMMMPAVRVDVSEDEDEVFVVADLPGVERENITASLLSPTELLISGERRPETTEAGEGGQVMRRERAVGEMKRVIPLPYAVTAECANASYTNGVLEIRLNKAERGERIPIE